MPTLRDVEAAAEEAVRKALDTIKPPKAKKADEDAGAGEKAKPVEVPPGPRLNALGKLFGWGHD